MSNGQKAGDTPPAESAWAIYDPDSEFVRHHDSVKWSRFQLVSVIEGAALYAWLQIDEISTALRAMLVVAATVIILFVFVMAVVDSRATHCHLTRIRKFEEQAGLPFKAGNFAPIFGMRTTRVAMCAIMIFNAVIVVWLLLGMVL